jgi:hypothetical protein
MAKLVLDLNKFKASGVYTVEFDASERIVVNSDIVRLIVGFSKKGVFNTPVFLSNVSAAKKIFGDIDKSLEKNGSYFHRAIETCLQTGPVFALNLMPFNNMPIHLGGDAVQYKSYSVAVNEENYLKKRELITSFYNKEKFWFPDTKNFIAITNFNGINKGSLFNLVNLSQTPVSVIVKKPDVPPSGFAITASEWFGLNNVPDFMNPGDFIEDYFVEVIVIEGDWTNYDNLSKDVEFSKYFLPSGLKMDQLEKFLNNENVILKGRFVGSIIPNFTDKEGNLLYIQRILNNFFAQTGIFCAINENAFDDYANSIKKLDLIGHGFIGTTKDTINMLSYVSPLNNFIGYPFVEIYDISSPTNVLNSQATVYTPNNPTDFYITPLSLGGNSGYFYNVLTIPKPPATATGFTVNDYNFIKDNLKDYSLIQTLFGNSSAGFDKKDYVKVKEVFENSNGLNIILETPEKILSPTVSGESKIPDKVTLIPSNTTLNFSSLSIIPNLGDIIYIKAPGYSEYFEVASASPTSIVIKTSGLSTGYPTFAVKYCKTSLAELQSAVANGLINLNDIEIYRWDVTKQDLVPFIHNISGLIRIIFEPYLGIEDNALSINWMEVYPGSKLFKDVKNKILNDGDVVYTSSSGDKKYLKYQKINYVIDSSSYVYYGLDGYRIYEYEDTNLTNITTPTNFKNFGQFYDSTGSLSTFPILIYPKFGDNVLNVVPFISGSMNASKTKFKITSSNASKIEVGYFIRNNDSLNPKLTRVISKIKKINPFTGLTEYEIETVDGVYTTASNEVEVYKPINKFVKTLNFEFFDGFKIKPYHLPDGTNSQLEKILGVIENTKIGETLLDKNIIDFRYIVDTFDTNIAPMMGAKTILGRLAKSKGKCLAILNAPSINNFMKSADPLFTEIPDPMSGNPTPLLNTDYIKDGGNLSAGPSFRFTLPDEENGAKHIGIYSPFLIYRDNNVNVFVPPAADVSNNFIRKFLSGNPYALVMGIKTGTLSNPKLVGLEYAFTLHDRENLETMGINPIIFLKNFGFVIFGNKTAYQKTVSAFNNVNVRDVLITIENDIEDILIRYVGSFNDATNRLEIKSIVESYLERVKNAGGIFDYSVIMDTTNNTPEIIDQSFGIIDIGIEPARGMTKIINRITILKTGTISSGGFTVA